jgi:hypothetical protein
MNPKAKYTIKEVNNGVMKLKGMSIMFLAI